MLTATNGLPEKFKSVPIEKTAGLLFALVLHGVLLYAAMSYKLLPPPEEAVTLFVNLINPPPPKKDDYQPEPPKSPQKVKLDKPQPLERSKPLPVLVSNAPVTSAAEAVAPPVVLSVVPTAPPESVIEAPLAAGPVVEAPPKPAAPLMMSLDLSLACPQRTPPSYPAVSRRLGEQGQVKLQVDLDETGRITFARVEESSGHKRLDEAGLAAVKSWQCNPSTRNGVAVRAVALQPFDFILEGR
jgi:protein TonB